MRHAFPPSNLFFTHTHSHTHAHTQSHLGQGGSGAGALRGHGQHSCDAQTDPGGCGIHVDPEGNPGQDDDEQRGDVHLDQVVAHLTLQVETSLDTGEFTWRGRGDKEDFLLKRKNLVPDKMQ